MDLIFPIVIFYAINKFKKQNANLLSLGQAIKIGLVAAVISALVYGAYALLFNYVIDPDFMNKMMEEKIRKKLLIICNFQEIFGKLLRMIYPGFQKNSIVLLVFFILHNYCQEKCCVV